MNREPLTVNPEPLTLPPSPCPYEGGTFKGRLCRLRPEEAAPSQAGGAAFVKHFIQISPISVNSLNLVSKFTEFTE